MGKEVDETQLNFLFLDSPRPCPYTVNPKNRVGRYLPDSREKLLGHFTRSFNPGFLLKGHFPY
jgi:hypothetical protein